MKNEPKRKRQRRRNRSPYAKYKKRAWDYSNELKRLTDCLKSGLGIDEARQAHNRRLALMRGYSVGLPGL